MVIKIDKKAIAFNINKAEKIAGGIPVSIMLKGFYEYIAGIECVKTRKLYSQGIPNSVCYALHSAGIRHSGAVVADFDDFQECYRACDIREFYIPLNADDDREGSNIRRIERLALRIRKYAKRRKTLHDDYVGMLERPSPRTASNRKKSGWSGHTFF